MARPLEVVTVRLFVDQKQRLERLFPRAGYNRALRAILEKYLNETEAKLQSTTKPEPPNV